MYYVQRKGNNILETVGEFETRREAELMKNEYRLSDHEGNYYVSKRCCKEWRET